MKIYTSYFAQLKKIKNPISICGKAPNWYFGPQYKNLAPKYNFFIDYKTGKISSDEYTIQFNKLVLANLNANQVIEDFKKIYPNVEEITLLCYEKIEDFCYRHIVAKWLTDNGFETKEKIFNR